MFNIGNEILMRKIAAAAAAPDGVAWAVISQCARLSPAADDQLSLVAYDVIAEKIGALLTSEPSAPPEVDHSWVTKDPKAKAKEREVTDFPEIVTKNV
jgi:hypothetical protein